MPRRVFRPAYSAYVRGPYSARAGYAAALFRVRRALRGPYSACAAYAAALFRVRRALRGPYSACAAYAAALFRVGRVLRGPYSACSAYAAALQWRSHAAHSRDSGATRIPSALPLTAASRPEEDSIIDGRVDGKHHSCPITTSLIGLSAREGPPVVARAVTISGSVDGNILARERIDPPPSAFVRGPPARPRRFTVQDGARFTGTVDPHKTEAAMQVARYRQRRGG